MRWNQTFHRRRLVGIIARSNSMIVRSYLLVVIDPSASEGTLTGLSEVIKRSLRWDQVSQVMSFLGHTCENVEYPKNRCKKLSSQGSAAYWSYSCTFDQRIGSRWQNLRRSWHDNRQFAIAEKWKFDVGLNPRVLLPSFSFLVTNILRKSVCDNVKLHHPVLNFFC